jgi:hypothetical protein
MKHYKASFKGERTLDQLQQAVGSNGGIVTRVHSEGGTTHVYFASEGEDKQRNNTGGSGGPVEVREDEVTRI